MLAINDYDIVSHNDKPLCIFDFKDIFLGYKNVIQGNINIQLFDEMQIDDVIEMFSEAINVFYSKYV